MYGQGLVVPAIEAAQLEDLFAALAGRAELDTWVASGWCNAVVAHELARERGVRLRVG